VVATIWLEKPRLVALRLTAGVVPDPDSATDWGLAGALSLIVSEPVRDPEALGVKVTETAQFAPGLSEPAQVLVSLKSPLAAMLLIVIVPLPVFVRVTVWAALLVPTAWLPKFKLVGLKLAAGWVPVPPSGINCGLPGAVMLSWMLTSADRFPGVLGANVTVTVQPSPGAKIAGR
jgi:hypothetical protein